MVVLRFSTCPKLWTSFVITFALFTSSSAFRFFKSGKNAVQSLQAFDADMENYEDHEKHERKILDYWKNGVRLDLRVVPAVNESVSDDDHFPAFPAKDIGRCILDLSAMCIRDRMARYIITMSGLDKINLYGSSVKLVKVRSLPAERWDQRSLDPVKKVDQSIDDFFDTFALRISLPKGNSKREMNQIEVMYEDRGAVEGRGGKGGGGGGKGGKGGGCKKMMMCMVMAAKMKMIGLVALMSMKGLMMAGLSMMMTKAMMIMQIMSKKGGGGHGGGGYGGGGYGGGGGGGQLKEIVLLTKASGGGGGGCGGGGGGGGGGCGGGAPPPPSSSYGAPPPSSYGAPPPTGGGGGGGGYDFNSQGGGGGGGGWGRSFGNGISMTSNTGQLSNRSSQIVNTSSIVGQPEIQDKFIGLNWITNYQPEGKRIGEVLEMAESGKSDYENANQRLDRKLNFDEGIGDNNINEPKIVYANNWRNYEATDRIWDAVGPIVASRVLPFTEEVE